MIKLIICDLDGTLCDHTPRMHLAASGDWDAYHAGLNDDMVNESVLWFLQNSDVPLVFLTGRPEQYRTETEEWLDRHELYEHDDYMTLLMRPRGMFGSDTVVKVETLNDWVKQMPVLDGVKPSEILVLEDRDKMVAVWRNAGYHCWQVNEGAF